MKFLDLVRSQNRFVACMLRTSKKTSDCNRTTCIVVKDCLSLCSEGEVPKLCKFLEDQLVVICRTSKASDVTSISRLSWISPPHRFIKMNTDGAWSRLNGESGGGVVFRHFFAYVLKAYSIRLGRLHSSNSAEFETYRVGLTIAIKLGYLDLIKEFDCLDLVKAIQGSRALYDGEREAVKSLPLDCLRHYSVGHVLREANSAADILALCGLSGSTEAERAKTESNFRLIVQEDARRVTRFRLKGLEMESKKHGRLQVADASFVWAGKGQKEDFGGIVSFVGKLHSSADELVRNGLYACEVNIGYCKALNKTIEILDELVEQSVRIKEEVMERMKAAFASRFGQEDILCSLIADACIHVCPKNPANFNADNVQVARFSGGDLHDCTVVRGMVIKTEAAGSIQRVEKAKVVVFDGSVDTSATEIKGIEQSVEQVSVFDGGVDTSAAETKGTEQSAEQLEKYSETEEAKVEELIKAVVESGAQVIVSGEAVGEMALHFCEHYKLMVLIICSKFELQRFCGITGAAPISKLGQPNPNDLGYVDSVCVEEIGGVRVTVVRSGNFVSTVVLRGSTDIILNNLERAIDDAVNTYKTMCQNSLSVPRAAATGVELARKLKEFSSNEIGLYQFVVDKFVESFEKAGPNAREIISSLYAEHASGSSTVRIDLEEGICKDVSTLDSRNLHDTKFFAHIHAADAACTAIKLDQDDWPSLRSLD